MTILQTVTNSFKQELYSGFHAFGSTYRTADTFKLALYTTAATLNENTTVYTTVGEATGGTYMAGGAVIVPIVPITVGPIAYVNFQKVNISPPNVPVNGGLIYNASRGNRSVAVLSFGGNKLTANNILTITFPVSGPTTALIRTTNS
jgi:hypothetical protein